jgi:hypothetical protein
MEPLALEQPTTGRDSRQVVLGNCRFPDRIDLAFAGDGDHRAVSLWSAGYSAGFERDDRTLVY